MTPPKLTCAQRARIMSWWKVGVTTKNIAIELCLRNKGIGPLNTIIEQVQSVIRALPKRGRKR